MYTRTATSRSLSSLSLRYIDILFSIYIICRDVDVRLSSAPHTVPSPLNKAIKVGIMYIMFMFENHYCEFKSTEVSRKQLDFIIIHWRFRKYYHIYKRGAMLYLNKTIVAVKMIQFLYILYTRAIQFYNSYTCIVMISTALLQYYCISLS